MRKDVVDLAVGHNHDLSWSAHLVDGCIGYNNINANYESGTITLTPLEELILPHGFWHILQKEVYPIELYYYISSVWVNANKVVDTNASPFFTVYSSGDSMQVIKIVNPSTTNNAEIYYQKF